MTDSASATIAPFPTNRVRPRAGLVLTGGGARAAYQVGVVKAVRDVLGNPKKNPFPILCGTSAGAINAATLAVFADDFSRAVANLLEVWENMHCRHIYRTDAWNILKSGAKWLTAMMLISRENPISLLDNSPLAEMLGRTLPFERIQANIDAGALYAACVTASGYTTGQSVSFFQGGSGLDGWERNQRIGAAVTLKLEYLMASAALPFIFPAVKVLFVTPSQPIERIAARFLHELPATVRFILKPTGALNRSGSNLASYLLFEESFCRALIDLGYQDTISREAELQEFFNPPEERAYG